MRLSQTCLRSAMKGFSILSTIPCCVSQSLGSHDGMAPKTTWIARHSFIEPRNYDAASQSISFGRPLLTKLGHQLIYILCSNIGHEDGIHPFWNSAYNNQTISILWSSNWEIWISISKSRKTSLTARFASRTLSRSSLSHQPLSSDLSLDSPVANLFRSPLLFLPSVSGITVPIPLSSRISAVLSLSSTRRLSFVARLPVFAVRLGGL